MLTKQQPARCALTFLAIQEPGVCKFCGICGTAFLKDTYILESDGGSDRLTRSGSNVETSNETTEIANDDHPRPSGFTLSQMLYAAFDVCVYCGGKYTD